MRPFSQSLRGSVVITALCFVAVLAIAVTTYLVIATRAMRLSKRTAEAGVTAQLAEIGLEQALSALNNNSWSGWTTSGKTARRTLSFAANKYGAAGATPTINLLVTNYSAATWSSATSYTAGDAAWYRGQWYQCTSATGPSNVPPPLASSNWSATAGAWDASIPYAVGDLATYNGTVYRCLSAHTSKVPPDTSTWTAVTANRWNGVTNYVAGDTVLHGGTIYRCLSAHINREPPNTSFWAGPPVLYAEGLADPRDNSATLRTQLRADYSPAPLFPNAVGATNPTTSISFVSSGTLESYNSNLLQHHLWDSSTSYVIGDTVLYAANGQYYRCVLGHSNQVPTNTAYWTPALSSYPAWNSALTYQIGDLVTQSGTVYRCILAHSNQAPPNASYWATQTLGYATWSSASVSYTVGTIVFYQPPAVDGRESSGMLYRCRTAHTSSASSTPTNTANWEVGTVGYTTWTSTTGFRTGDIAFYPVTGLFYRCVTNHTNQAPVVSGATNTTYWLPLHTNFAPWSSTVAYQVGDLVYRSANSTIYRCIQAHTGQTPPNASFWSTSVFDYGAVVAAPAVTSSSTATIRGYVNASSTSFGGSAYVLGPNSSGSPRVDPSRVSSSYYVPRFDPPASYAALSSSGSNLPASEGNGTLLYRGARTLGTPGATSPSIYNITGTYTGVSSATSGIYLNSSTDVLTIVGPVILNVSGYLYTSSGRLIIAPTGSLEIYFNGGQLYLGSSTTNTGGGVFNQTFDPRKLLIVSASTTNTSAYHYLWQWNPFHGLIYMPDAYLHKWNSGYNGENYGAFSAKTVYFNHAANLDYDSALRTAGSLGTYLERPYQVSTWRELTNPLDRITLP
jgi:hypothetical protein